MDIDQELNEVEDAGNTEELEKLRYFQKIIPEIINLDTIPNARSSTALKIDGR